MDTGSFVRMSRYPSLCPITTLIGEDALPKGIFADRNLLKNPYFDPKNLYIRDP